MNLVTQTVSLLSAIQRSGTDNCPQITEIPQIISNPKTANLFCFPILGNLRNLRTASRVTFLDCVTYAGTARSRTCRARAAPRSHGSPHCRRRTKAAAPCCASFSPRILTKVARGAYPTHPPAWQIYPDRAGFCASLGGAPAHDRQVCFPASGSHSSKTCPYHLLSRLRAA